MDESQIATQHIGVVLKLYGDLEPGALPPAMILLAPKCQPEKAAYITQMHAIEDCEILWADRGALLQRRMIQMHVGAFAPNTQKACTFKVAGTCREMGSHMSTH